MKKLSTVFLILSFMLNIVLGVTVFYNNFDNGVVDKTEAAAADMPSNFFNRPAVYGPEGIEIIEGDAVVNCAGIWLQNMLITGDLFLTEEIGEGSAALKNVTVMGKTYVAGGGEESIYLEDSTLEEVVVNKDNGLVKVVARGKTTINSIRVEGQALVEESEIEEGFEGFKELIIDKNASAEVYGNFETIHLIGENASLNFQSGKAGSLLLAKEAKETEIEIAEEVVIEKTVFDAAIELTLKGVIEELTINSSGLTILSGNFKNIICTQTASYIELVDGTYENITVQEDISSISIQVGSEAVVEKLELNSRTAVTGTGIIKHAVINHANCSFEKLPEKFDVKSGIKFTAGGEEYPKPVEKPEPAPKPAPTQPSPSPSQPKPAPEPKPTDIKIFIDRPGTTLGMKIVIVELYASDPKNYSVFVLEGNKETRLDPQTVDGKQVFRGEVSSEYAEQKYVRVR